MISATTISPLNRRIVDGGTPLFSFGNALQFDGVNDYVSIPTITLAGEFSISMWSKDITTIDNPIIGNLNSDGWITYRASVNRIRFNNATIGSVVISSLPGILTNDWNHFFITRNASNLVTVIVNNDTARTGTLAGTFTFTTLGTSATNLYRQVTQDEFAIWNLDIGNQASNLYNDRNGDYATNYSPDNLQAYWRMNGSGTDTIAVDEQGNYDGTLNNFPASGMWVAH